MKVKFSPLVSQASGSAGPVVASRWKGINYFRERVIPANPKSTDQVTQRGHMTRVVAWYHDLEEQVSDYLKVLATGLPMSGFNMFTKRNVRDLAAPLACRIMPLSTPVNAINTLAAVTGAGSGEIDLTWLQGDAVDGDQIYVLGGVTAVLDAEPDNLAVIEKETTTVQSEARTLAGLDPAANYTLYVLVENIATSTFSIACRDSALALA